MKKLDIVRLINEKPYLKYNLKNNMHGIIVETFASSINAMFFNPQNIGDYALINIKQQDYVIENEKLPAYIQKELLSKLDNITKKEKNTFKTSNIKEYDMVELLVEDSKYTKYGIHKGDRGCVMDSNAVQNCIEVDFSYIDDSGNFCGDCISVNIDHLKVIE